MNNDYYTEPNSLPKESLVITQINYGDDYFGLLDIPTDPKDVITTFELVSNANVFTDVEYAMNPMMASLQVLTKVCSLYGVRNLNDLVFEFDDIDKKVVYDLLKSNRES